MLVVKDTGPGIPKEEIPRVMQAFGQGSLAHQTAEGGTGLGLPIVQNLVSLHGGTFRLRSMLRKGTEAIVWLPPGRVLRAAPKRLGPGLGPGEGAGSPGGPEAEPWWRLRTGRTSQQATTGC
jgi:two-component system cell cycle sensor histidine kinase PleC